MEPTTFLYTGGEEAGYVVGLINYPRFPTEPDAVLEKAHGLASNLLERTAQHSILIMTPTETTWITKREDKSP